MVGTGNAPVVAQQDGEHRSWQPAGWRRWDKAPSLLWAGGQGGTRRARVLLVVVVVVHDHDVTVQVLAAGPLVADVEGKREREPAASSEKRELRRRDERGEAGNQPVSNGRQLLMEIYCNRNNVVNINNINNY